MLTNSILQWHRQLPTSPANLGGETQAISMLLVEHNRSYKFDTRPLISEYD